MVLDVLKTTAVEEAYEAVEQLRVLAMERPRDAHHLLQENPALVSAVIMILQHAKRISFGPLPPEAFDATSTTIASPIAPPAAAAAASGDPAPTQERTTPSSLQTSGSPVDGSTTNVRGHNNGGDDAFTQGASSSTSHGVSQQNEAGSVETGNILQITDEQRKQAIQSIQHMQEADVERILTLSPSDLSRVPDPGQRKQLEVLQQCLIEMTRELQSS